MTEQEDPQKLADHLEGGAEEMDDRSERLGGEIAATRDEWEAKRADRTIPGAVPRPDRDPDEGPAEFPGKSDPED